MKKSLVLVGLLTFVLGISAARAQTSSTTSTNKSFFGKIFTLDHPNSAVENKTVVANPRVNGIPPNMVNGVENPAVTVTTSLKAFKIKDNNVAGIEPNMSHFSFVDASNVEHSVDIPPNMVKGLILDSNNAVRFIEIEPNMVKVPSVDAGGAVSGIPPNMIEPNM